MEPAPGQTRIPVRSHRQAMDWSLVLLSQGIEAIVQRPVDDDGWSLIVAEGDAEKALAALRQYRRENRSTAWSESLPWPKDNFDWTSLVWAVLLIIFYVLSVRRPGFERHGIMDTDAVFAGQWWRVSTAIMLHADLGHLAMNLSIGALLFGLAMGRYGTGLGLLAAYLAGIAGNLASLFLNLKPFLGLGASGMIMGALGLLSAQSLLWARSPDRSWKRLLGSVAGGIMLFTLYGFAPESDIAAHAGGFAAGLAFGAGLVFVPERWIRNAWVNLLAGLILVALVLVTWELALTRGR